MRNQLIMRNQLTNFRYNMANKLLLGLIAFFLIQCAKTTPKRNAINAYQDTIHQAIEAGSAIQLQALLDQGAAVNAFNVAGKSTLHLAVARGDLALVQILLKSKPDVNIKDTAFGQTPLHLAAEKGCLPIMQTLLQQPNIHINTQDYCCGKTALHWAVQNGDPAIVAELLKLPTIQVNIADKNQNTPLQLANLLGHEDMIHQLIAKGATINPAA